MKAVSRVVLQAIHHDVISMASGETVCKQIIALQVYVDDFCILIKYGSLVRQQYNKPNMKLIPTLNG
jgi:hypothetical protein